MGRHLPGLHLQQTSQLRLVRGQDRRRLALAEQLEPARVGVQAVGVHQQRRLDRHGDGARELLGALGAAQARAQDHRPGALRQLLDVAHAGRRVEAVVVREAAAHLLEQAQVHRLLNRSGTATCTYPAPAREADRAAIVGAPVSPAEPPTTTTTPESNFDPLRSRCG